MLLGEGYWVDLGTTYTLSYSAYNNGISTTPGYKTAMVISLPGSQVGVGGWHVFADPFNYSVPVDDGSYTGDMIFFTDGISAKCWGDAYTSGWCEADAFGWDETDQCSYTLGYDGTTDESGLSVGRAYQFCTNRDNLALIIPEISTTCPSVTVSKAATQADPTSASPINFTVTFSEPVFGFSNSGVTMDGTAGATTALITDSGDHATYNVAVTGMTASGTVVLSILAGAATNANDNANTASSGTDNTVTYNLVPIFNATLVANALSYDVSTTLNVGGSQGLVVTVGTDELSGCFYMQDPGTGIPLRHSRELFGAVAGDWWRHGYCPGITAD